MIILSVLRTGYFSTAADVLTSCPKILHVNKKVFLDCNFHSSARWIWKRCCDGDFNRSWTRLPYCLLEDPLKLDFLDIYLSTIWESVTSKIHNLWGSSFYWKYLKFNLDLRKWTINSEKDFCFWGNCIWIGIVKLSLLRTGFFSSAANLLTSSPKIFHVSKRGFFNSIGLAMIIDYYKGAVV